MPTPTKPQTFGPYSPIRKAGNVYFVSGQVGVDPATQGTGESVQAQTEQAIKNLLTILATEGLTLKDVVKTTVYLIDMEHFEAMNNVYLSHFSNPRPARSTVAVKELPRVGGGTPIVVELEAVAVKDKP